MVNHAYAIRFSGRVDKERGIISDVSVITEGTARGWNEEIDAITLSQVVSCANQFSGGLKVVDRHTRGTDSIFSTAGVLKNFRIADGHVRADLHILSTEPNRDKLLEMADTMPDTFGLSIAFSGPLEEKDGKNYARCTEIYNAALVDVPAANYTGLFSAKFDNGIGVSVDANINNSNQSQMMTPEEILKQCEAKIASSITELSARIKSAEDTISNFAKEFECNTKKMSEFSSKLESSTTELSAKIGDDQKRMELTAQLVAKEFARHTGQSPTIKADGNAEASQQPNLTDKFIGLVQKHFSATKSKTKALENALSEDPKGYSAFRSSGTEIKWA